jgi:hypothetical protein
MRIVATTTSAAGKSPSAELLIPSASDFGRDKFPQKTERNGDERQRKSAAVARSNGVNINDSPQRSPLLVIRGVDQMLDVRTFGDALIATQDLGPTYCAIYRAKLSIQQLLVYVYFYHLGLAAALSEKEGGEYWDWMRIAAVNEQPPNRFGLPGGRWPRASERRHFRGEKCVKAVEQLRRRFVEPEAAIRGLASATRDTTLINRVMDWPMCAARRNRCSDCRAERYRDIGRAGSNRALMHPRS